MDSCIEIDSFNPYETRFPNRKLVTIDTLKLIKLLRQQGFNVIVLPQNDMQVQYLFKKGIVQIFADQINILVRNLPTTVIMGLIINYIQKQLDKPRKKRQDSKTINENIFITENSTNITNDLNGRKYLKGELTDIAKKKKQEIDDFGKCFNQKSPYPDMPTPILLEHKPRIVGWGRIADDEHGLKIEEGLILDKNILRKIGTGKIKGASITGIAEKSVCSICNSNYVECNHITGDIYEDKECTNTIWEATIIELSLVKEPINSKCLVNLK